MRPFRDIDTQWIDDLVEKGDWDALWRSLPRLDEVGRLGVLNDCDFVPARYLVQCRSKTYMGGDTFFAQDWRYDIDAEQGNVTAKSLGDSPILDRSRDTENLINRPYLAAANAYILTTRLDVGHWALKHYGYGSSVTFDKDASSVIEEGAQKAALEDIFAADFRAMKECDGIQLEGSLGSHRLTSCAVDLGETIYVPRTVDCVVPGSFENNYDQFGEMSEEGMHREESDGFAYERALELLRASPMESLTFGVVSAAERVAKASGIQGTFTLEIDEKGEAWLTAANEEE